MWFHPDRDCYGVKLSMNYGCHIFFKHIPLDIVGYIKLYHVISLYSHDIAIISSFFPVKSPFVLHVSPWRLAMAAPFWPQNEDSEGPASEEKRWGLLPDHGKNTMVIWCIDAAATVIRYPFFSSKNHVVRNIKCCDWVCQNFQRRLIDWKSTKLHNLLLVKVCSR
jgi:hypothetical protein